MQVNVGDKVLLGDVIAIVGTSGRSSAIHLDYSVATYTTRRSLDGDKRYDPILFDGYLKYGSDDETDFEQENLNMYVNIPKKLNTTCLCNNCQNRMRLICNKYNIEE